MSIIEEGYFLFENYENGLRLGVFENQNNVHNGIKSGFEPLIVNIVIPSVV